MKIIIIGCGKVGKTLAEQLQAESELDLTLVDISQSKLVLGFRCDYSEEDKMTV